MSLTIEENNVKPFPRCKQPLTRGIGFYDAPRLLFFNQGAYMLPDCFFIIYNCYIQNPSPQIPYRHSPFISAEIFRFSGGGNETTTFWERKAESILKKCKITPKVFRFSSDIPFHVISLIRPPGLPGKKADRRIWRMKAIVRRLAFVHFFINICSHIRC